MRLIDADVLQAKFIHGRFDDTYVSNTQIIEAPTVDAEVVVRCKDCIHCDMGVCLKIYSDGNAHPDAWQPRKPEDFCSYGERKDNDNETD